MNRAEFQLERTFIVRLNCFVFRVDHRAELLQKAILRYLIHVGELSALALVTRARAGIALLYKFSAENCIVWYESTSS